MTPPLTPTRESTSPPTTHTNRDIRTAPQRARDTGRPPSPRSSTGWLVWTGVVAALAAAIGLVVVGVAHEPEAARSARADQASSARLQGLADEYEVARRARADRASSARLQGLADEYEVARRARADRASSARLQGRADQYRLHRPDLFVEPAG